MRREPTAYQNCRFSAGTVVQVELVAVFRFGPQEKVFGPDSSERIAQEEICSARYATDEPRSARCGSNNLTKIIVPRMQRSPLPDLLAGLLIPSAARTSPRKKPCCCPSGNLHSVGTAIPQAYFHWHGKPHRLPIRKSGAAGESLNLLERKVFSSRRANSFCAGRKPLAADCSQSNHVSSETEA